MHTPRGIKTSEFWLTVLGMLSLLLLVLAGRMTSEAALAIAGSAGSYALSRGIAKGRAAGASTVIEHRKAARPIASPAPAPAAPSSPPLPGIASTAVALVGLLLISVLMSACSTRPPKPQTPPPLTPARIEAIASLAVYATVSEDLAKHPEHRSCIASTTRLVGNFVQARQWDLSSVASLLEGCGLLQAHGSEGTLIIAGTVLLLDAFGAGDFHPEIPEHVEALIRGICVGLNMADNGPLTRGRSDNHQRWLSQLEADAVATRPAPHK